MPQIIPMVCYTDANLLLTGLWVLLIFVNAYNIMEYQRGQWTMSAFRISSVTMG